MNVGSTDAGGGGLAIDYDFDQPAHATANVSIGGQTLYVSLFPSFAWVGPGEVSATLFALPEQTQITLEIVAISPASQPSSVSVRLPNGTVDAPGESVLVGNTSSIIGDHVHPQWQMLLADGVVAESTISFRIRTNARSFAASPVYTLTLTNAELTETPTAAAATATPTLVASTATVTAGASPTPTWIPSATVRPTSTRRPMPSATATRLAATETPTSTPSPTIVPLLGDVNCDGTRSAADLPAWIRSVAGAIDTCGADADGDETLNEADLEIIVERIFAPAS